MDQNNQSLEAQLIALRAENEALKAKHTPGITLKVSEKGCVSCYGLSRFPVSLYRSQMEKLLDAAPKIREFIKVNADKLKVKEP